MFVWCSLVLLFFFFKQKTAYEMRISDWSSDVCSSDLLLLEVDERTGFSDAFTHLRTGAPCSDRIGLMNVLLAEGVNLGLRKMAAEIGRASCRERVCKYV